MSNRNTPQSARFRGWFFDQLNGTLEAFHGATRVFGSTASALTIDLATTFSGAQTYGSTQRGSAAGVFGFGAGTTSTIVSGVLAATKGYMVMDAEGAGTTDQLDSITTSWTVADGDLLLLIPNTTDTITVDDANINLGAATRAVAPGGSLLLRYDGGETQWTELVFVAASDNV